MGVIRIGVGTAKMGRICRDKAGNITEQSTARWDADPAGGSVAIWPMDPEKMEPSGPAEVYGDWDAAAYLRRVVDLIQPNRQINIPDLCGHDPGRRKGWGGYLYLLPGLQLPGLYRE